MSRKQNKVLDIKKTTENKLKLEVEDLLDFLSDFDEGIIIADKNGNIVFYNKAQGEIDGLDPDYTLGKRVVEVYALDRKTSLIHQCLDSKQPIVGRIFFYKTRRGKTAYTVDSVYPFFDEDGEIKGAICIVRDYTTLERTWLSISLPEKKKNEIKGNGTKYSFSDLVGNNPKFVQVVKLARLAASSPSPIMFYGESGTGKELFAQSVHNYSPRKEKSFVAINCSAIPENLLEGLLFGTSKGAFTGAVDRPGLFEQANGGTLFLDELNSMPINLQSKLLRVVQEQKVRRLGSTRDIEIDVKLISSVNIDPHLAIKQGLLRLDLFYRLGVVLISIPPLRERKDDIELLTNHFIYKNNQRLGKDVKGVSPEVSQFFMEYDWPGNVRELEHIIEGAMNVMAGEDYITKEHLPLHFIHPDFREIIEHVSGITTDKDLDFEQKGGILLPPVIRESSHLDNIISAKKDFRQIQKEQEKKAVYEALKAHKGNVTRAAKSLGISRQLLHYKMKKYNLKREDFR